MTPAVTDAARPVILAVDDTPENLHLLSELLKADYRVKVANSGERALRTIASGPPPDLILLDVMMPGMSGYEVCRVLKSDPATKDIPVIFVTAMAEIENEEAGLALGAVDYITKPISPPILLARVRNHLKLHQQSMQLQEWNRTLARRVAEGIEEIERLGRLRRFFSPAVADLLLSGQTDDPLMAHRRQIVVVFLDLRGYTAFTEAYGADEVMRVLGEFHAAMGELIMAHSGTLERFAGDGLMIFFNDPIEIADPVGTALSMTQAMHRRLAELQALWQQRGYTLAMGIGIAQGIATIGAIGFEGRRDYGAIGSVTNLAARLCGEAKGGQTLVSEVAARHARTGLLRQVEPLKLKGFKGLVTAFEVT